MFVVNSEHIRIVLYCCKSTFGKEVAVCFWCLRTNISTTNNPSKWSRYCRGTYFLYGIQINTIRHVHVCKTKAILIQDVLSLVWYLYLQSPRRLQLRQVQQQLQQLQRPQQLQHKLHPQLNVSCQHNLVKLKRRHTIS